jgi:nicotinamide riboside kinase
MKIIVCWSHGVGKSTIAKALQEKFSIPVLHDIVVDAHKLWFLINEDTPMETQMWLTGKQLEQEKIHTAFIGDKCIFDYYVYAKALGMDDHMTHAIKKVALTTYDYDHIFFIKPEFPIVDDGLRSTNVAFQSIVHTTYEDFLKEEGIPFSYVTWSVEERLEQIYKKIDI